MGLGSYNDKRAQQVPVQTGRSRLYLNRAQLDAWSNQHWPAVAEGAHLTRTTLLRAAQEAEATGASFAVLMIPSKEEVFAPWLGARATEDPWNRPRNSQDMLAFCESDGLVCLDVFDTLQKATEAGAVPYFQNDGHLNETGHQLVAEYLDTMLFQQKTP